LPRSTRRAPEPPAPAAASDSKGTIARVVEILRCFAEHGGELPLSKISAQIALPRSTTHRLLQLLKTERLVETDGPYEGYRAGRELFRIAALLSARMPIVQIGTPILRAIVDACDETCLLGAFDRDRLSMTFVAKVDSTKPIRYAIDLNVARSLVWGATGRAILAFLEDDDIDRAVASNREPSASGSMRVDRRALRDDVTSIRRNGYAISEGQRIASSIGIAAPFFLADGFVAGDIALTIPEFRYDARQRARLIDSVVKGASEMSAALGYVAPASLPAKDAKRGTAR
jgi:DNA-binding IclR family transcriptional regulator